MLFFFAAGTFGGKNSWLYNMNLTDIQISDGDSSEAQDSDEEDGMTTFIAHTMLLLFLI